MGIDIKTLALAKKYTKDSLKGAGALKGEKGDKGPKGDKGDKGDTPSLTMGNVTSGETPTAKIRTEDGTNFLDLTLPKGEKGDKGDTGATGPAGADGAQGPAGADGIQGPAGPKGDTGAQGPAGKDGKDGTNGKDGSSFSIHADYASKDALIADHPTGSAGDAYFVGDSSAQNPPDVYIWLDESQEWYNNGPLQGVKGDKGDQGDPGKDGKDGKDGAQGPQGERGPQGKQGVQGLPGADGADGKDGADGFSPSIDFDTTTRTDGTIVTVHNKDGDGSFVVKNGKDGASGSGSGSGETYKLTQDTSDPNKIILTDSKGNRQSVTVKGKEYTFKPDKDNPMKIHLTNSKDEKDDQSVEIPSHYTAVEGYPTPVGTIISYMGKTAPANYLVCDGSVYNIADYPELAGFIKAQFGAYEYFGGDGTATFAVPSLGGEFLRGAGDNTHANQGNGGKVGEHQDATELSKNVATSGYVWITQPPLPENSDSISLNYDAEESTNYAGKVMAEGKSDAGYITTRPTNTSVLYCIKYRSDLVLNNVYSEQETVVGRWVDGKPIYRKVTLFDTPIDIYASGTTIPTNKQIINVEHVLGGLVFRDDACSVIQYVSKGFDIYAGGSGSISSCTGYILEYTKTTDDAGTMSTPVSYTEYDTTATDTEVQEVLDE